MDNHLENARHALVDLESEIQRRGEIWDELTGIATSPAGATGNRQWRDDHESRCWIYATTAPEEFMLRHDKDHEAQKLKAADATTIVKQWAKNIERFRSPDEFDERHLVQTEDDERLAEFIARLEGLYTAGGIATKRGKLALNSFLHYLRQSYADEQVAFVEEIFPLRSEIFDSRIKRLIRDERRPLPEEKAAAIIKNLVHTAIRGRPDARKNCMKALALCWICLKVARLRHPTRLDDLYQLPVKRLFNADRTNTLQLPTHFGMQQVQVSTYCSRFIIEMHLEAENQGATTLLNADPQTLRRTLNRAIGRAGFNSDLKQISFLSFLSPPHQAGLHKR